LRLGIGKYIFFHSLSGILVIELYPPNDPTYLTH